jgi:Tol biopolymer transport system component
VLKKAFLEEETTETTSAPEWSPDGKTIATYVGSGDAMGHFALLNADTLTTKQKVNPSHLIKNFAWLNNSDLGVVYTTPDRLFSGQVGVMSIRDGQVKPVTNDTNFYSAYAMSATEDGKQMLAIQLELPGELDLGTPEELFSPQQKATKLLDLRSANNINWSEPETIVLFDQNGRVSYISPNTGAKSEVNISGFVFGGCLAGKSLVYAKFNEAGGPELWRSEREGSNPQKIVDDPVITGTCSKDGKWVYFATRKSSSQVGTLMRASTDTWKVENLGIPSNGFALSNDGSRLAIPRLSGSSTANYKQTINIVDTATLKVIREIPIGLSGTGALHFAPDNATLIYNRRDAKADNFYRIRPDKDQPEQITRFTDQQLATFDFSPDGKRIALLRGREMRDMVLIADETK